jgi:hypothetical protein
MRIEFTHHLTSGPCWSVWPHFFASRGCGQRAVDLWWLCFYALRWLKWHVLTACVDWTKECAWYCTTICQCRPLEATPVHERLLWTHYHVDRGRYKNHEPVCSRWLWGRLQPRPSWHLGWTGIVSFHVTLGWTGIVSFHTMGNSLLSKDEAFASKAQTRFISSCRCCWPGGNLVRGVL